MANKFPLDLSKFKRISSDDKTTTLHHPAGHKITVAHNALTPKMRGQLAAMPMAKGGEVKETVPKNPDKNYDPYNDDKDNPDLKPAPKSDANVSMADGGGVGMPSNPAIEKHQGDWFDQQIDPKVQEEENAKIAEAQQKYKAMGGEIKQSNPKLEESKKTPRYANGTPDQPVQQSDNQSQPTVVINTGGQSAQQPQATPEPLAHHIGAAVRQGVADTLQAMKTATAPVVQAGQNFASGLMGPPSPDQPTPAGAPAPQPQANQAPDQAAPSSPQQPQDPFGTNATLQSFQKGLGETKAGISGEAAATGQEGQEQAQDLGQMVQKQQDNLQNYQDHYNYLDNERQAFQQDLQQQHIDPKHYLNSLGTAGKISTGIGLILGGMGGGLMHQANPALEFLNRNIDRDIDAQKANLGKSESLLNANMRQFGNLKDATDMTKIMQSDIVSNQLKQAAATAMTPLAKARAMQAAGQIDMNTAQLQGQMAMRKTLLTGMNNGKVDPAKVVNLLIPENQRAAANKELSDAQMMGKARDNVLSAFDQLAKINTVSGRLGSPIQSAKQVHALKDPIVAGLSKETAGRFTESDAKMLDSMFPSPGDNDQTIRTKRSQAIKLITEKMNFPILQTYGINPAGASGRYNNSGAPRVQNLPPNIKSE